MSAVPQEVLDRLRALGLQGEPFTVQKVRIFSPESPKIVFADGFGALDDIDHYLKTCIDNRKTAFIGVSGQTGTGRSVAGQYVLQRWMALRQVPPARLIAPEIDEMHNDDQALIGEWFIKMSTLAKRIAQVPDAVRNDLLAELRQTGAPYAALLNQHALTYSDFFRAANPAVAVAICLDDITKAAYLKRCRTIFDDADVLCICTMTSELALAANAAASGWTMMELNALQGNDVAAFIEDYWHQYTLNVLPFDLAVVQRAFAQKTLTIAKIRTLMREVLISKLLWSPDAAWGDAAFKRALEFAEVGLNRKIGADGTVGGE
jgi:hypothetical protein